VYKQYNDNTDFKRLTLIGLLFFSRYDVISRIASRIAQCNTEFDRIARLVMR